MHLIPTIQIDTNPTHPSFSTTKHKIEFSHANAQAFDECGYVKSIDRIMHLYYTVTGYTKCDGEWKTVFDAHTFDFPQIENLLFFLSQFIDNKIPPEKYQKTKQGSYDLYTASLQSSTFGEDYYELVHTIRGQDDEMQEECFSLIVASSESTEDDKCVKFPKLCREDLREIRNCVEFFLNTVVERTNQIIHARNEKMLASWRTDGKKIYQLGEDGKSVEYVFPVGSQVEVTMLRGDLNTEDFYSDEYNNVTIDKVKGDRIIVSGGYTEMRTLGKYVRISTAELPLNKILYINEDVPEEKLNYNESEIADDFIEVLTETEKREFCELNADTLFKKWKEAIMNKTWMCRTEHKLPHRVKDDGNHSNVYASIVYIIGLIKGKLIAQQNKP